VFDSWQGQEIFLYSTESRPAMWSIQDLIQWVSSALSPLVKRLVCEADNSSPSSTEVKIGGAIPPLLKTLRLRLS
jgi:hypothetical protein